MPKINFSASRIRKTRRKKSSMVMKAIRSSILSHGREGARIGKPPPPPKVERPSAWRNIWSICWMAALVAGDVAAS